MGDFVHSDGMSDAFPDASDALRAHAPAVLATLLVEACQRAGRDLEELEQEDLSRALLEAVAPLALPVEVHERVPRLCWAFLRDLERAGRLAGGRDMGNTLKALRARYAEVAAGKPKPIKNPGSKLNRNDPCPCGSGKKYKKCCLNR